MAKDRTRHARRIWAKAPSGAVDRQRYTGTVEALDRLINGAALALVDFTDTVSGAVSDFTEKYRKLTNEHD